MSDSGAGESENASGAGQHDNGSGEVRSKNKGSGKAAAAHATRNESPHITIEGLGTVQLPPKEDLAFLGGLAVLAAAGILEWPFAAVLGVGHILTQSKRNKALHEFGDALEEGV